MWEAGKKQGSRQHTVQVARHAVSKTEQEDILGRPRKQVQPSWLGRGPEKVIWELRSKFLRTGDSKCTGRGAGTSFTAVRQNNEGLNISCNLLDPHIHIVLATQHTTERRLFPQSYVAG